MKESPYPYIGKCIYCGKTESIAEKLTDEHVIPFSLGGREILRSASCEACQVEINKFETYFTRELIGDFRSANKIKSRKKHKKRTHSKATIRLDGEQKKVVTLPITEHPAPLHLPHFPQPGFFSGNAKEEDWPELSWGTWSRNFRTNQLPLGNLKYTPIDEYQHIPIARSLAKIAHCYAIFRFGSDTFEPLLPSIIRGMDENIAFYVGAIPGRHSPSMLRKTSLNYFHSLDLYTSNGISYIIHCIRFFVGIGRDIKINPTGTPYFITVAGIPNEKFFKQNFSKYTVTDKNVMFYKIKGNLDFQIKLLEKKL